MFVSLGNQPERRSGNKLMAGNSRAHSRWRVAGNHVKLCHVLPACKECLDWMEYANVGVGNDWQGTSKECTICTNWMIGGLDSPLLAFSPSATFPKGYLLGGRWSGSNGIKVYPIELTYDTLKRAAMVTQQKLLSGEWSPTVAKSHLKENGINKGYRNQIVRQGGNRRTFDLMKEKAECGGAGVVELAAWQKIQKEKELFPTKYSMPKTPSLWNRDLPLRLFVDTPMHLLFLGIAKSVFGKISLWLARCGRGPAF
jgi:hypothetical protein